VSPVKRSWVRTDRKADSPNKDKLSSKTLNKQSDFKDPLYGVINDIKNFLGDILMRLENIDIGMENLNDDELKYVLEKLPVVMELYSKYNLDDCSVEDYEAKFESFKKIVGVIKNEKHTQIKKLENRIILEKQKIEDLKDIHKNLSRGKYSVEMIKNLNYRNEASELEKMLKVVEDKLFNKTKEVEGSLQDLERMIEKLNSYDLNRMIEPVHKWEPIIDKIRMPSREPGEIEERERKIGRRCKICGKEEKTMYPI